MVIPRGAEESFGLSQSLTDMVCRQGKAIWINNETAIDDAASLNEFADGLCVPLVHQETTLGAVHLYRTTGRFREQDFDLALTLSRLLGVALARVRQQTRLQVDHQRLVDESADVDEMIGESPPVLELKSRMEKIGRATGCVLICGESGSGKELVARGVHRCSARVDRPMLSVNCAAIAPNLMESQLFGHSKGAFTGAESDHAGWFRQADSGTLFLDEVGELSLEGQAKLLRILEGHSFQPVGSTEEVTVDVRVIGPPIRISVIMCSRENFAKIFIIDSVSLNFTFHRCANVETTLSDWLIFFSSTFAASMVDRRYGCRTRLERTC